MPKLRGAVVGLGVGRSHAEAYAQLPQTELVAVCDTNEARLRPVAEQYRCRAYASVEDLLADREVELVSVATPHPSHAELSIRAMRAGKHVLVEKPMAVDLAEADRMIRVSRETGRTLAVVFQRRWWPAARNVRRAIDEGKIGRPILGQCSLTWWRTKAYYDRDPWRGRWDTEGGGVLINQAIHAIDMFQWLMGGQAASSTEGAASSTEGAASSAEGAASSTEGAASSTEGVEEVVGRWTNLTHPYLEVEDTAAALLRFRGGALGVLSASSSVRLSQHRITIHGSKGHSVGVIEEPEGAVGYNDVWTVPGEEELPKRSLADHVARGEYIYRSGRYVNTELDPADDQTWPTGYRFAEAAQPNYHARQIADLVDALRSGRRPLVDGVEGRKSVAILLAIYQSGRTGQPVRLSQPAAV